MAMILAYTSPALGHVLPISALLSELSRRGHAVHLRTFSAGMEIGQRLGFTTDAIDQQIEHFPRGGIAPVHVLEHHQHRLAPSQALDLRDHDLKGLLLALLRGEVERRVAITSWDR